MFWSFWCREGNKVPVLNNLCEFHSILYSIQTQFTDAPGHHIYYMSKYLSCTNISARHFVLISLSLSALAVCVYDCVLCVCLCMYYTGASAAVVASAVARAYHVRYGLTIIMGVCLLVLGNESPGADDYKVLRCRRVVCSSRLQNKHHHHKVVEVCRKSTTTQPVCPHNMPTNACLLRVQTPILRHHCVVCCVSLRHRQFYFYYYHYKPIDSNSIYHLRFTSCASRSEHALWSYKNAKIICSSPPQQQIIYTHVNVCALSCGVLHSCNLYTQNTNTRKHIHTEIASSFWCFLWPVLYYNVLLCMFYLNVCIYICIICTFVHVSVPCVCQCWYVCLCGCLRSKFAGRVRASALVPCAFLAVSR